MRYISLRGRARSAFHQPPRGCRTHNVSMVTCMRDAQPQNHPELVRLHLIEENSLTLVRSDKNDCRSQRMRPCDFVDEQFETDAN